jgi:intracellular multiplication protein IcmL
MTSITQQPLVDDALVLVHVRNEFYKEKHRMVIGVLFLGLVVIGALVGMLVYLAKHPAHPLYFVTDDAGRLIQDVPLSEPNMSTAQVAAWTKEAVEAAYSYNFINYRLQLQNAQKYFVDFGWHNYMQGLEKSGNLLALTQRKFVVMAQVIGQPKLIGSGRLGAAGILGWKFEMPMLVTYLRPPYDDKSRFSNPLTVTVLVERQSILSSYKGLGVVQIVGTLSSAAPAPAQ